MAGAETATFSIKVLGDFRLQSSTGLLDVPSSKLVCLLTYLACTAPTPQPRERLATLLWGSSGEDRARHNLRQALFKLRQILGQECLVSVGEAITLVDGLVDCDAANLVKLIADRSPSSASQAADLYSGALLENVFVDETTWNEWLLGQREKLADCAMNAMVQNGESELKAGRPASALQYGQRAVMLDRFREDAHRLIMGALAASGRTPEAIRHFNGLAIYLKAELEAEPDEETRLFVRRLIGVGSAKGAELLVQSRQLPPSRLVSPPARQDKTTSPTDAMAPQTNEVSRGPSDATDLSRRRQVTVLVCGPSVSAEEAQRSGSNNRAGLVSTLRRHAADVAARYDGHVVPSADDVVQLYFGYLGSRRNDVTHAVRVGMALVAGATDGDAASLRAGIATGYVAVGKAGSPDGMERPVAVVEAAALANQLQASAPCGAVVVSHATRLLLGNAFKFDAMAGIQALGSAEQPQAWRVQAEREEDVAVMKWIKEVAAPTKFDDGSYIFKVGDPTDQLYYVQAGTVVMEEIGIRVHSGDMFGEIAFFTRQGERSMSARCEGPCEIICCSETDIVRRFLKDPPLGLNILRMHAKRLVEYPFPADKVVIASWRHDFGE